jgi:hypothetical protein
MFKIMAQPCRSSEELAARLLSLIMRRTGRRQKDELRDSIHCVGSDMGVNKRHDATLDVRSLKKRGPKIDSSLTRHACAPLHPFVWSAQATPILYAYTCAITNNE